MTVIIFDEMRDDWRPIPGFEDYEINRAGEVWSEKSDCYMETNYGGRYWVKMRQDGKRYTRAVSKLVDAAFPEYVIKQPDIDLIFDYTKEVLGIELELWQKNKFKKWIKDHRMKTNE